MNDMHLVTRPLDKRHASLDNEPLPSSVEYGGSSADDTAGSEIGLQQLIDIVRRQWLLLLAISLGTLLGAVALTFLLTPRYTGETVLKLDPNARPVALDNNDMRGNNPQSDQSVLDTETQIIQSRQIARGVIQSLGLDKIEEFQPRHPEQLGTPQAVLEAEVDTFLSKLTVKRDTDNYLINVQFNAQDSDLAARIANAVADAYVVSSVQQRTRVATAQAQWLDQRLHTLAGEVQVAENKAAQYKAEAGIMGDTTQGTVTDQQVAPITTALAQAEQEDAQARADLVTARAQIARGETGSISSVLASPVIADLRRQRAEVTKELSDVETRYGPNHPEYQRVTDQVAKLDRAIQDEYGRVVAGLEAKARTASSQAGTLQSSLARIKGEKASNAKAAAFADAYDREAKAKQTAYEELAHKLEVASQAQHDQIPTAMIIERAVPSAMPSFPNRPLFAALGLVLGLLVGFATVLLRDLFNGSVRFAEDLGRTTGLPFLVSIPAMSVQDLTIDGERVTPTDLIVERPISAYSEAFRTLRSTIMLSATAVPRVISVLSALPAEGKSTVSTSLARNMATNHDRVIILDCDLRRGRVGDLTQARGEFGIVEVLLGQCAWRDAVVRDSKSDLEILPLSGRNFTSADLFSGSAMHQLLQELRAEYEFIILDTPPVLAVADARMVASLADVSIFISASGQTPRRAARSAIELLEIDNSPLLGAVLTKADRAARRGSRKDPSYYYEEYAKYVDSAA